MALVVPPFEGSVRSGALIARGLAARGLRVLRFDFANHVGDSGGDPIRFTVSSAHADLVDMVDFARTELRASRLLLVTSSLATRVALRFLAYRVDVEALVSILGVLHLGHTFRVATGHEVGPLLRNPGYRYGLLDVRSQQLDGDRWMRDMVAHDWHSLEAAQADVQRCATPTYWISAELDEWNRDADFDQVFAANGAIMRRHERLPGLGHFPTAFQMKRLAAAAVAAIAAAIRLG